MPKTKFQEVVFTILMVFVMVYAMICYNIALNIGGMSNEVFLSAFHELVIMGPAAFVLDFFIVGNLAKKESVPNCACRTGQSFSSGAGNFCSICNMDVSADESGGNTVI